MSAPPPKNTKSTLVQEWPEGQEAEPAYRVVPQDTVPNQAEEPFLPNEGKPTPVDS